MIPVTQVKKGMTLKIEGELYKVTDVFHHTQGRGYAIVKLKLKNLKDGRQIELRLQSGEKVEQAYLERVPMTFIYEEGDLYYFMNNETYEQIPI
ncbi:MAG: elongation factor P, partial [Candidatus Aminicenantes bacterium]|nr:elongation factor P [Candidatus Aminicenantes bacterium]